MVVAECAEAEKQKGVDLSMPCFARVARVGGAAGLAVPVDAGVVVAASCATASDGEANIFFGAVWGELVMSPSDRSAPLARRPAVAARDVAPDVEPSSSTRTLPPLGAGVSGLRSDASMGAEAPSVQTAVTPQLYCFVD